MGGTSLGGHRVRSKLTRPTSSSRLATLLPAPWDLSTQSSGWKGPGRTAQPLLPVCSPTCSSQCPHSTTGRKRSLLPPGKRTLQKSIASVPQHSQLCARPSSSHGTGVCTQPPRHREQQKQRRAPHACRSCVFKWEGVPGDSAPPAVRYGGLRAECQARQWTNHTCAASWREV